VEQAAFYQVAAEAIPILFIALLLQMDYFTAENRDPQLNLFVLSLVVFAAIGELIAIAALADNKDPNGIQKIAVLGAITVLFLPLLVRAARPLVKSIEESPGPARTVLRTAAAIFLFGVTVLALVFPDAFGSFIAIFAMAFFIVVNFVGNRLDNKAADTEEDN
jgi:Kef-type K+ transport system membrane component KefB